ncbi:MAG: hypothetical protein ACREC9_12385 [Methylocella sp.]
MILSKSQQLDFLLILLRATPFCENVDFYLPVAKCRAAVAAATTRAALDAAVDAYESDRALVIRNIVARLPAPEYAAIEAAFNHAVDFQSATHASPERAS